MTDESVLRCLTHSLAAHPLPAAALIACAAAALCAAAFFIGRAWGRLEAQKNQHALIRQQREDAVRRSRAVIGGQVSEQLAPFLPGFPCNAGDVRFIGKPVDFVGFVGINANAPVQEILFIEVKTGASPLSKREQEIKEAVQKKRVRYIEYRIG